MILYRDMAPARVTVATLRAPYLPRIWATMMTFRVEHDGYIADVELMQVPAPGLPSGFRTALRCPVCGFPSVALRCVPAGYGRAPGFQCARCGGWRGRARRYPAELPAPRHAELVPSNQLTPNPEPSSAP